MLFFLAKNSSFLWNEGYIRINFVIGDWKYEIMVADIENNSIRKINCFHTQYLLCMRDSPEHKHKLFVFFLGPLIIFVFFIRWTHEIIGIVSACYCCTALAMNYEFIFLSHRCVMYCIFIVSLKRSNCENKILNFYEFLFSLDIFCVLQKKKSIFFLMFFKSFFMLSCKIIRFLRMPTPMS